MKKMLMVLTMALFAFAIGCDNTFLDLTPPCEECECLTNADCADGDLCTVDVCDVDNTCVQIPSDNPACEPEPPECVPTEEVCNSRDDDCDELADEGLINLGPCGLPSVGECEDGHLLCTSGTVVCVDAIPATDEICDDLDNDCDGETDEDCYGCDENADCDDHVPCTVDFCEVSGICRHLPSDDPACEPEPECRTDADCAHFDGECLVFRCLALSCFAYERDDDGDGRSLCGGLPEGERYDCDDHDPEIRPGATEACDSVDNDCDGLTDEGSVCPPAPACTSHSHHSCASYVTGPRYPADFCSSFFISGPPVFPWVNWVTYGQVVPSECAEDTWCAPMDSSTYEVSVAKFAFMVQIETGVIPRIAFTVLQGDASLDAWLTLRGRVPFSGEWVSIRKEKIVPSGEGSPGDQIVFENIAVPPEVEISYVELSLSGFGADHPELGEIFQFGIMSAGDIDVGHEICFLSGLPMIASTKLVVAE